MRVADGIAKPVRVIGKGNRERLVPIPKDFGLVFGFWLSDRGKDDFGFAKAGVKAKLWWRRLPSAAAVPQRC